MKRTLVNLIAAAVIALGSLALFSTVPVQAAQEQSCCTAGNGAKCCGDQGCVAGESFCEAW